MNNGRRTFLKRALYGIMTTVGLGYGAALLTVLAPRRGKRPELVFVPLIAEDEVPRIGVRKTELVYSTSGREHRSRVFLVAAPSGLTVLSAVCTHLGCLVNYRRDQQEFLCPCHGGRYDLAGRNIGGPPPAPLAIYPHRIEGGMVLVGVKT